MTNLAQERTITITDHDFPDLSVEKSALEGTGIELVMANADSPQELIETVSEANGLLVQYAEITDEVFDALDNLLAVSRCRIGVDNVNKEAGRQRASMW